MHKASDGDLHGAATSYYQQLVPQGEIYTRTQHLPMYISGMGSTRCKTTNQQLVPKGEIYTQDMVLCIYQNGIYTQRCDYYQQPATRGRSLDMVNPCIYQNGILHGSAATTTSSLAIREKYTPRDMAFLHVYIRMGSTRCARLLPAACATRRTGTWHLSMYISENGIYTVHRCNYDRKPKGRNIHLGARHSSMYISEWIYRCSAALPLPAACATRRNIHPGTWHSSAYMVNGSYTVQRRDYYQQLVPQEKMGHGIPPCVYQNGIYTVQRCAYHQQLVPQGRNIHPGTWHSSMYIPEWDLHGAATSYYQQLCHKGRNIHQGHGITHVYQNGICNGAALSRLPPAASATREK
jgi:hypothetical protein